MLSERIYGRRYDMCLMGLTARDTWPWLKPVDALAFLNGFLGSDRIEPGNRPLRIEPSEDPMIGPGRWVWENEIDGRGLNFVSYWSPTFELLIGEAKNSPLVMEKKMFCNLAQEIIVDDVPAIWYYSETSIWGVQSNFVGFASGSLWWVFEAGPYGWIEIYDEQLDEDGDGWRDMWEYWNGFDPSNASDIHADWDNDGVENIDEILLGLQKHSFDTDRDGMSDGWELVMGFDPKDPEDAMEDYDNDGIPNVWEFRMNLNATNEYDADFDLDDDGLSNLHEYQLNLRHDSPDTDGDGLPDGYEVQVGLIPNNPDDASFKAFSVTFPVKSINTILDFSGSFCISIFSSSVM